MTVEGGGIAERVVRRGLLIPDESEKNEEKTTATTN